MDARLELQIEKIQGKTAVAYNCFTGPLKIGTPNANGDHLHLILMMASAGLLKDDRFRYHITCGKNTRTVLTEQSYSKIFDTGGGIAVRRTEICLKENASLCYRPSAVIPFAGSSFAGSMTIRLEKESEFLCSDILAAGRVGMGEQFAFSSYRNRICVTADGKPVWLDHCCLEPKRMDLSKMVFLDGHTHQGAFYYYGSEEKQKRLLDHKAKASVMLGVTAAAAGVCVRALADTAQDIEEEFLRLENEVGYHEV